MLMVIVTWSTFIVDQFIDVIGQREPVRRDAQLDIGDFLGDQGEGFLGLLPVVAGIAGPGDAENGKLRHLVGDGDDLAHCLLGRQLFGDDAGTAFVGAIVFAIAVIALNVAGRRDRNMHAGEIVMRLFRIAGMVLDAVPHLRRQIAGIGRSSRMSPMIEHPDFVSVSRIASVDVGTSKLSSDTKFAIMRLLGTGTCPPAPFQAACQKLTIRF